MPQLLLWDVDTQVDFMEPGGKLYVPGAEKIADNVRRLNHAAAEHHILVISSADAHQLTDPEFQDYPPHCLAGTPGQKKVTGTVLARSYVIPNRKLELSQDVSEFQQIIVEKQSLDVFTNPNVEQLLRQVVTGKRVVLYGVVTEICVDRAARGLITRGYHVDLVRDAIQHLDPKLGQATLAEVERCGGKLLTTDEVISQLTGHAA